MAIAPRDRFLTFKKDNFTCQYCDQKFTYEELECDHVIPKSKGGKDELNNYITACVSCNRKKRDRLVIKPKPEELLRVIKITRKPFIRTLTFHNMARGFQYAVITVCDWKMKWETKITIDKEGKVKTEEKNEPNH